MNRKLLTADEVVSRATDVKAVPCHICDGEGFTDTDTLCWNCSGSGAVLVTVLRPKRPIEVTWKTVVGIGIVFAAVLSILLISLSEYFSSR